jgi:CrcB protein
MDCLVRGLLIALGAGIGAPARYVVDRSIQQIHGSDWPLGTLAVNIIGAFVLGLTVGSSASTVLLFGTGFAGTFTTWSTFAVESIALIEDRRHHVAWLSIVFTVLLGIPAAALGRFLVS